MNRRNFLRLLGIGAATAVVAPEMILDPERELWVPGAKKIFDLGATPPMMSLTSPFRIVLPDGTVWNFDGIVKAIAPQVSLDGEILTTLEIQPSGPMTFDEVERPNVQRHGLQLATSMPAHASILGDAAVELRDIELPRLEREVFQVPTPLGADFEEYIPGLRRCSPVTMTLQGSFAPETLSALFDHRPGEPVRAPEKPRRRR